MHDHKEVGHKHPVSEITESIISIFTDMGFSVATGPEIETEYYNFDALNIPKNHPARDMWDTFWIKDPKGISNDKSQMSKLLRTHTSPVQIRYMENNKPPLRIIAPGKVFRHEATDATHEAQFFQIEGLVVDKGISLSHLKGVLQSFFEKLFSTKTDVRFRPSFFPFVEPAVEIDMSCFKCSKKGCATCKGTGWIEIMGAGMVHPDVLKGCGIDPAIYTGFAFGGGIDRFVMAKYEIPDVRMLYNGDLRLVNQF